MPGGDVYSWHPPLKGQLTLLGNSSDGCEVNLQSDANSCGACGIVCATGQICSNSTCQAAPTGQVPGTPVSSPANHNPLAPAVADVNGDGKLDIPVANAESGSLLTGLRPRRGG